MTGGNDYEALELLSSDQEYDEVRGRSRFLTKMKRHNIAIPYMTIGVFIFFFLDVIAFIYIGKLLMDNKRSVLDLDNLEFRNPYIGLHELYESSKINVSHYDTVINEPRLSTQISPALPDQVFPIDAHRWLSDFGLLSPPDRHFQVSSTKSIHTVVQFHILDYGMENCSLTIRLPGREGIAHSPFSLPTVWDVVPLRICEIDAKRPLKERHISWETRPKCVRPLGVVKAKVNGETEVENFHCRSGSFIGYQIYCEDDSPQCDIDVWTNQNATWGIFIQQHQTIL